ncbi:MAG: RAMP superfamily CRISPR-associated protein [Planctomycetaceae bacterium]
MSGDSQGPVSMADISLSIHFLSDWHVGEGAGRPGSVDRIVRRHPADDLPYIPAKTIIGMWRDACEHVATGLDEKSVPFAEPQPGTWQALVNAIFGDQANQRVQHFDRLRSAALKVRPARFPAALRRQLTKSVMLKSALTFVKPGVKLDPRTGQAADNCLRFEELVRGGATLETSIELDCDEAQRDAMLALLWAGAQSVERLGGKRRRGLGRCSWNLDGLGISTEQVLGLLKGEPPTITPDFEPIEDESAIEESLEAGATDWVRIPIRLTPLTPLVIPKQVTGNVVESLDYIPGTQLLAAFSRVLRNVIKGNVGVAIAGGAVRVLNAYPDVDGNRGRPVPFVLFHDKLSGGLKSEEDETQLVWNRLVECEPEHKQLKQHRAGYLGVAAKALPPYTTVDLQIATHGAIDDLPQRPTSDVGGVYSYEAIPAAQGTGGTFRTEIWIQKGLLKGGNSGTSAVVLPPEIRVGIAKKDDYGLVKVEVESQSEASCSVDTSNDSVVEVTLWCLSTVLLRDASLRNVGGAETLTSHLLRRFGESVSSVKVVPSALGPDHRINAAIRTSRTEGWLANWQLPRPSFVGIEAGSCVRLRFEVSDHAAFWRTLQEMQGAGVGERRAEGFGEIAINPPLLESQLSQLRRAKKEQQEQSEVQQPQDFLGASDAGFHYAQRLEEAAWQKSIITFAQRWAHKSRRGELHWAESKPENSQLGALRAVVSSLRVTDDLPRLKDWLGHLKATANRREKWPTEAIGKLEELCEAPEIVWKWLGSQGNEDAFPVATQPSHRTDELQERFLMSALRTVLIAAVQTEIRMREKPAVAVGGGE